MADRELAVAFEQFREILRHGVAPDTLHALPQFGDACLRQVDAYRCADISWDEFMQVACIKRAVRKNIVVIGSMYDQPHIGEPTPPPVELADNQSANSMYSAYSMDCMSASAPPVEDDDDVIAAIVSKLRMLTVDEKWSVKGYLDFAPWAHVRSKRGIKDKQP